MLGERVSGIDNADEGEGAPGRALEDQEWHFCFCIFRGSVADPGAFATLTLSGLRIECYYIGKQAVTGSSDAYLRSSCLGSVGTCAVRGRDIWQFSALRRRLCAQMP